MLLHRLSGICFQHILKLDGFFTPVVLGAV
jgi:hypothetical protein